MKSKYVVHRSLLFVGIISLLLIAGNPANVVCQDIQPVFFPELTGPYQVGKMSSHLVNPSFEVIDGLTAQRELMIQVFYPAEPLPGTEPAAYVEEPLRSMLAAHLGVPSELFELVQAHAYADAPLAETNAGCPFNAFEFVNPAHEIAIGQMLGALFQVIDLGVFPELFELIQAHAYADAPLEEANSGYPVLLFSPGGGEQPLFYTAMLEEFASHGYIVVSIPEPGDTPVILFPDGHAITTGQSGFVADEEFQERCQQHPLCAQALEGDKDALNSIMDFGMRNNRLQDVLFTLDYLEQLNREDPRFASFLDLDRIGVFGHSFGGATAVQVGALDPRVKAVINMDGYVFYVVPEDAAPLSLPVMFMKAEEPELSWEDQFDYQQLSFASVEYLLPTVPFYFFELDGSTHATYKSDQMLLEQFMPDEHRVLGIEPERAVQIINRYALAFFEKHLKDREEPLLDGSSFEYPEVWFERQPATNPVVIPTILPDKPTHLQIFGYF